MSNLLAFVILVIISILFFVVGARVAYGDTYQAPGMRAALDQYGADFASYQGWTYVDYSNIKSGDYKKAYFDTNYVITGPLTTCNKNNKCYVNPGDEFEIDWAVETLVVRCSKGVYAISTPYDTNNCSGGWLPKW